MSEIGLSGSNAEASSSTTSRTVSLAELLRASRAQRNFTSNTVLDTLFLPQSDQQPGSSSQRRAKTGLPRGSLLDLAGAPGEGKSRIAIGYALGARIVPQIEADRKGKVTLSWLIVADNEGDLAPQAIYDAALVQCGDAELAEQACSGVHHVRCTSTEEFVAILLCLDDWLDAHPRVQLVIIDCLSTHLRTVLFPILPADENVKPSSKAITTKKRARDSWGSGAVDQDDDGPVAMRASVIALVKRTLTDLTASRNLAVIVTNQIATKHVNSSGVRVSPMASSNAVFDPQLGQLWQPPNTFRVILFGEHDGTRRAVLYETPYGHSRQSVRYAVDAGGICDVK